MIGEGGDNRENADLLDFIYNLNPIFGVTGFLRGEIEEGVVMVVQIINADFKDALTLILLVRLDELYADVQMVERFHAEVILLPVIFNIIVKIVWFILC